MTIWDNIYKRFSVGGEAWATLSEEIIPQFITFVDETVFEYKSAFDIGCGTGKYMSYLQQKGFVVSGIDSSETAINLTKGGFGDIDAKCADMFDYQIPDQKYDFIISISTIHHGLKVEVSTLVDKIYYALLPEGKIFITLPDFESNNKLNAFNDQEKLAPETYAPLIGPEKGLAHSFYSESEIKEIFKKFKNVKLDLDEIGRWIITATK